MRTVCYNSYLYFGDSLGNALTKLGHDVEYFKVDEDALDDLEEYIGKHYDAIIDFNSDSVNLITFFICLLFLL